MKIRFTLKQYFVVLLVVGGLIIPAIGLTYKECYDRRQRTRQLFESGFSLAYDRESVRRLWKNPGFGGFHEPEDRPTGLMLDTPVNQTWLNFFDLIELANPVKVVSGNRSWLDKNQFPGFIDKDLEPIAKMTGLTELSLNWNSVTDDGLSCLSNLKKLKKLELEGCDVSDQGAKIIGALDEIEYLSLSYTKITDDGVGELTRLKNLRFLSLEGTSNTSNALKNLVRMKKLQHLNLADTRLTQENVDSLAVLTELVSLDCSSTKVSYLSHVLPGMSELRDLYVCNTEVDDRLIESLAELSLESLDVEGTKISQMSFKPILELRLKKYFCGDDTRLTFEQLEEIDRRIDSN